MSLPSFATQTVTVLRAPMADDHGDDVPDWSQSPTQFTITGACVAPPRVRHALNVHDVTTELMIYAPADADLLDTDRIIFNGITYAIRGEVIRYQAGVLDHIEAYLDTITPVA